MQIMSIQISSDTESSFAKTANSTLHVHSSVKCDALKEDGEGRVIKFFKNRSK